MSRARKRIEARLSQDVELYHDMTALLEDPEERLREYVDRLNVNIAEREYLLERIEMHSLIVKAETVPATDMDGRPLDIRTKCLLARFSDLKLDTSVYFLQMKTGAADGGPIKIGSAINIRPRLAALQTGAPWPLEVLAQFPGTLEDERALHREYAQHRLHGEWFQPTPSLMQLIADLSRPPTTGWLLSANGGDSP